jgi:hypothetical protein
MMHRAADAQHFVCINAAAAAAAAATGDQRLHSPDVAAAQLRCRPAAHVAAAAAGADAGSDAPDSCRHTTV